MRCTAPTSHLHPPSHGPQQHTGRSYASRATGLTSCRTAVNLRWQIISCARRTHVGVSLLCQYKNWRSGGHRRTDHAPQRAVRAQQPHLGAAHAALAREEALGWIISSKISMLVLLLQPPAANARKKRSVPRLERSRQRVRSHGSSGPQSARSCSKCVREWFEKGSHQGLIVELCSCIISWPCSSSMVMAVSSTSSGSASELEDQLGLDESTNSKKEERYSTGNWIPRRVAVGDLPTSSRGAVQLVLQTVYSM